MDACLHLTVLNFPHSDNGWSRVSIILKSLLSVIVAFIMTGGDAILPVRSRKRNHKKKPTTVKTTLTTTESKEVKTAKDGVGKDEETVVITESEIMVSSEGIASGIEVEKNDEDASKKVVSEEHKLFKEQELHEKNETSKQSPEKSEDVDDNEMYGETGEPKQLSPFVQPQEPLYLEGLSDFSKLIEVLRTKFLPAQEYSSCGDNEAKIRCCLNQKEVLLGFSKFASNVFFESQRKESRKSESRAKDFRSQGNKFFKAKRWNEALDSFSKAVLTAPFFLRAPHSSSSETTQDEKKSTTKQTSSSLTPSPSSSNDNDSPEAKSYSITQNTFSSREFALSLANRSATLFQLNHFEDSLFDAQTALEYDYPIEQRHTLLLRQSLCLKSLGRVKEAQEKLEETLGACSTNAAQSPKCSQTLQEDSESHSESDRDGTTSPQTQHTDISIQSFIEETFDKFTSCPATDPNRPEGSTGEEHLKPVDRNGSRLKNASDWVKLCHDLTKGRLLKTSISVSGDETVLSESAYATALNTQSLESFCLHCCVELRHRLVPCGSCSAVRYCSVYCRNSSWSQYHRYECQHFDLLLSMGVLRLSLRIILTAGIQECLSVDSQMNKNSNNGAMSNKETVTSSYKSIYNLCDHSKDLNPLVSARQTLAAAFMTFILSEKVMGVMHSQDENYYRIGGIILKHIHQISVNSILMFHQPIVSGPHDIYGIDVKSQAIGTAVYPTLSLINHSCVPNTDTFFRGNVVFVKTRQPIPAQTEITLSYGQLYNKASRSERMESLENQYYFSCQCPACEDKTMDRDVVDDPNLREEHSLVLTDAFICPSCCPSSKDCSPGPLLINFKNQSSKCLRCGVTTADVSNIVERVESAKKTINLCKALSSFGRKAESEKHLLKTLTSLNTVCYPCNRLLLAITSELLSLFLSLDKFEESKRYCEEANMFKRVIYGKESFEYHQGILHLLNIRWMQQKKWQESSSCISSVRTSSINRKLVHKMIQESNEAVSAGMELLNRSKVSGGLVPLDSALVSFLKELVQLERHLKQNA